jgi:hypothetical protein
LHIVHVPDVNADITGDKSLYLQANNLFRECEAGKLCVSISTMDGMDTVKKLREEIPETDSENSASDE